MRRFKGHFEVVPRYAGEFEMEKLYLDQNNMVAVGYLKEQVFGGTFLNGATAEMTLFDVSGATVSGVSFPITLTYQTNSPGIYEGVLPGESLSITEGVEYDLDVEITSGGRQVANWTKRLVAVHRRA